MSILWDTKLPNPLVDQNYGEEKLYYFLKTIKYYNDDKHANSYNNPPYNCYIYLGGNDNNNFVEFFKLLYQKNITIFGVKILNKFKIDNKFLHNGYYNYKLSTDLFKIKEIKKDIESNGIKTTEKETLPPKKFKSYLWFIKKPEIDNKFIVTVKCEKFKNQKFILNKETEHTCYLCNFKNYFVSIDSDSSKTLFDIKDCRVTLCHNHIKHKYSIELHRKYNDEETKNKIEFIAKTLRQRNKNSLICFFSCDFDYNDVGNYIPTTDDDNFFNCEIIIFSFNNKSMYGVFSTKSLKIGDELYINYDNNSDKISEKLKLQDCYKYGKLKKNALPNRITIGEVRKIQANAPSPTQSLLTGYKQPAPAQAHPKHSSGKTGGISKTLNNLIITYDSNIEKFNKANYPNNQIEFLSSLIIGKYLKNLNSESDETKQFKFFENTILPDFYTKLTPNQVGELINLIMKNSKPKKNTQQSTARLLPAPYNAILYNGNALNIRDYGGSGDCFFRALQGILSKFGSRLTIVELRTQFERFIFNKLIDAIAVTTDDLEFYRNSFASLFAYDGLQRQVNDSTINCLRQMLRMENAEPDTLLDTLFTNLRTNYNDHKVAFANCFTTSMRYRYYYINEAQLPWSGNFIKSLNIPIALNSDQIIEGLILMNLARDLSGVTSNYSTLYPNYSAGFDLNNYEFFEFSEQQATNNILIFRTGEHFQAGFHLLNGTIEENNPNSYLFDRRIENWTNANGFPAEDRVRIRLN